MKRYVEVRTLGKGSYGASSVVEDVKAKGTAVLRVRKALSLATFKRVDLDETLKEIRYIGRLRHPAIPKLFDMVVEGRCLNIIHEHCESSLDAIIQQAKKEGRFIVEPQIINWLIQMLFGVYYLHEKKILHRNLKPGNILIQHNTVKLSDIGLSRIIMHESTADALFPFTPHYLAPEVVTYRGYRAASDVWSIGCILYEMCALKHAFDFAAGATTTKTLFRIVATGSTIEAPKIPSNYAAHFQRIIDLTLVREVAARPTCAEILRSPFVAKQIFEQLRIQPAKAPAEDFDDNVAERIANISINPRKRDATFSTLRDYIKASGPEMVRDFLPKNVKDDKQDDDQLDEDEETDEYPDELQVHRRRFRVSSQNQADTLTRANYRMPIGDETQVPRIQNWEEQQDSEGWSDEEAPSPCDILPDDSDGLMKVLPPAMEREVTNDTEDLNEKNEEDDSEDEEVSPTLARTASAKRDLIMFDPNNIADPYSARIGQAKYAAMVAKAQKIFGNRYGEIHAAVTNSFKISNNNNRAKQPSQKQATDGIKSADLLIVEQIVFLESNW